MADLETFQTIYTLCQFHNSIREVFFKLICSSEMSLVMSLCVPLTCISCIFSSSSGLMPSWPPMTVSRSLLRLLFPVTETVTSTGLMATAAAAVRRAIPARGAISSARGFAWDWAAPPLRSAAEMLRHYFLTRISRDVFNSRCWCSCQLPRWSLFAFIIIQNDDGAWENLGS